MSEELVPCPDCNWEGVTPSAVGWQYDPSDPEANSEGLVKCKRCEGEGYLKANA